jgi:hypothetical protein
MTQPSKVSSSVKPIVAMRLTGAKLTLIWAEYLYGADALSQRAERRLFEAGTAALAGHLHLPALSGRLEESRNDCWLPPV